MDDLISRQDVSAWLFNMGFKKLADMLMDEKRFPSAQPEIIRCKDCKYGEQDEIGRWYCRGLGCQIGDDDGSGFCSDAERRE